MGGLLLWRRYLAGAGQDVYEAWGTRREGDVSVPAPDLLPPEPPATPDPVAQAEEAGAGVAVPVRLLAGTPGAAAALPDGSAPGPEYTIKGNASSKLFHLPSSPYYRRTKAEAWFRTAEEAERAGFTEWKPKPRGRADQ